MTTPEFFLLGPNGLWLGSIDLAAGWRTGSPTVRWRKLPTDDAADLPSFVIERIQSALEKQLLGQIIPADPRRRPQQFERYDDL